MSQVARDRTARLIATAMLVTGDHLDIDENEHTFDGNVLRQHPA